jgi:hypothetical protein
MNELGLEKFNYSTNKYTRNGKVYNATDIIEVSKNLEPFDLLIKGIDLGVCTWGEIDIKDFAEHMIRVNDSNLDYPIILDDTGFICDGWHRVVKAIIKGDSTIKAVRLTVMPEPIVTK